jgi:hypothetical protein
MRGPVCVTRVIWTRSIAADPKHLGARIGITSVLHTWGSAMTHHPHAHMIVPGGGISLDDQRWISCRPGFFLPVRVLSRLFRRLFLEKLVAAHQAGRLSFFGDHARLVDAQAFTAFLAPLRKIEWVVYSKRPFGGPEAVLTYLSRYTHRVAIATRKSSHRARRFSTGHGTARSEFRLPSQILVQLAEFDATRCSFVTHFTVKQLVASARSKSAPLPAAPNSP